MTQYWPLSRHLRCKVRARSFRVELHSWVGGSCTAHCRLSVILFIILLLWIILTTGYCLLFCTNLSSLPRKENRSKRPFFWRPLTIPCIGRTQIKWLLIQGQFLSAFQQNWNLTNAGTSWLSLGLVTYGESKFQVMLGCMCVHSVYIITK